MTQPNRIKTGQPAFDTLVPRVQGFLEKDIMAMNIDGVPIRGFRSPDTPSVWIRDHSDILRGGRFFEKDLQSAVQHFADTQARNGRIFDYFTVQPEKVPCEKENWCKYVRVPVEADVEYRFVKAAFLAWQATGDSHWIAQLLPNLEAALGYAFSHPLRWDPATQLVKRPYTIDSWDFAYSAGSHDWLQFQIDEKTFWGIMHGDNSGYFEACRLLAVMLDDLGQPDRATYWRDFAHGLRQRMNEVCWNGRFYTHFVKQTPVTIDGVDESEQLSFSNAMNINRGVASHAQAVSILQEYQRRGKRSKAFAEWFSIDPPFPDGIFGEEKIVAGAYCNGGIMPLVGGELALAYLSHGMEQQGIETLRKYSEMVARKNETFLWYFPDGRESSIDTSTSPDATPTDGWGSSSMLHALVEGLVGLGDRGKLFQTVDLSPRWAAAEIGEARVAFAYPASGTSFSYQYACKPDRIELSLQAKSSRGKAHVLLPQGRAASGVASSHGEIEFSTSQIESSSYVDFPFTFEGGLDLTIRLA